MTSSLPALNEWVQKVQSLCEAKNVHWCDGSDEENRSLISAMTDSGDLIPLNEKTHPRSFLHRSATNDVARTEHLTFVCTSNKEDAGPNNNWLPIEEGHARIDALFKGAMRGRTMYVIPYCMGPYDSPFSRCGVEITDSPYVVINMRIMTRMGAKALERIEREGKFVKGLHSTGDLSEERRFIMHFPEELTIKSIGSGYGGNALLGKKCHALRIGSYQAQKEGWLAEHMLIVGVETPAKETFYFAAAFPSACGKTNLAMLVPPESYKGWKIWTVGDDIAWMHLGSDGKLYAINPEAGFFGVAPGTSEKSNPNALHMLNHDTIFTNVALTEDDQPWWEGLDSRSPKWDWKGQPYDKAKGPAAHPNSRFTVSAKQCAAASAQMEAPQGVPISGIIFGGRRANLVPLVFQAKSWEHGVMCGAAVASETTAAASGKVGVLRRDPMAMKPFCGYNFADYWQHWISFAKRSESLPEIFHVNWFRQDENGRFMWPGFGDNIRALEWMVGRIKNTVPAVESPIGFLPTPGSINTAGLDIGEAQIDRLLHVDAQAYISEFEEFGEYLATYGDRVPEEFLKLKENILADLKGVPQGMMAPIGKKNSSPQVRA